MSQSRNKQIFINHLPALAVDYCYSLWQDLGFQFKITRKRQSKYGDYRYDPRSKSHAISVNNDMNKYAFLVTYIHEVAHLTTHNQYHGKVSPHGNEWKLEFKKLMLPMLREHIFPMEVLSPLAQHMKNPKATSFSDKKLFEALRAFDDNQSGILLKNITIGTKFLFNRKVYTKLEVKRTRSLCALNNSERKYLISESASVFPFQH